MGEVAAAIHPLAEVVEAAAVGVVTQPEEEAAEAAGQPAQEEAEGAEPSAGAEEAK